MSSKHPKGLKLNKKYIVGDCIGSGAQASVYALKDLAGNEVNFVAKMAYAPPKTNPKKKPSPEYLNAISIFKESTIYQNMLPDLRGSIVPMTPVGEACFGEVEGFRYLIIERMECELFDILPRLLSSAHEVDLGPIAGRLVDIVHTIHKKNHLLVDIKPENFMIAKGSSSESIESRIRLIDLGLLKRRVGVMDFQGAKNEGSDLEGTPLFVSCNIHNGDSPSRRDDVESLIYLISEAIIRLTALAEGTEEGLESRKRGTNFLPWSAEPSAELLGIVKKTQVSNPGSEFYSRMPSDVASIIFECLQEVQSYSFSAEPNYAKIRDMLTTIKISSAAKKRNINEAARKSRGPKKRRAVASAPSDASSSGDPMDIDEIVDQTIVDRSKALKSTGDLVGAALEFTEGPYKGSILTMLQGSTESLCLSAKATSDATAQRWVTLEQELSLGDSTMYLSLSARRRNCTIILTCHGSKGNVFINSREVDSGIAVPVFFDDFLTFGTSRVFIRKYSNDVEKVVHVPTRNTTSADSLRNNYDEKENFGRAKALVILVVNGPDAGSRFYMEDGVTFCVGTNPSKKGTPLQLSQNSGLALNHARFSFVKGRINKVRVTDLHAPGGIFLRGERIRAGGSSEALPGDRLKLGSTELEIQRHVR